MGLKHEIELDNGIKLNEAYTRVDTINGYKGSITISVNTYSSQVAFERDKDYMQQRFYEFVPDVSEKSDGIWVQAYNFLKKIEEFSDSKDV